MNLDLCHTTRASAVQVLSFLAIAVAGACGGDDADLSGAAGDVLRLTRFEIVDRDGFGAPIVAYSFLAPADWRLEGDVRWNPSARCPFDLVSVQARVSDPGGDRFFEIFPGYATQWIETYAAMGAASHGTCATARPMSPADFIRQAFVPGFRPAASVSGIEARPGAAEAYHRHVLRREGEQLRRSGVRVQVDAAEARLRYDTGSGPAEEWVVATSTVGTLDVLQMTFIENVMSFGAPASELDASRRLFGAIVGSYRINPVWERAVMNVIESVSAAQAAGRIAEIGRIRADSRRLFDEWSASVDRRDTDWRRRMAADDDLHRQFTEAIRGTETYRDPLDSGVSWELPNDYEYVWKTATDEFILTNNVDYNPNEALNSSDWEQMRVER